MTFRPTKQLLNGIHKYNNENNLQFSKWKYIGGDTDEHYRWWKLHQKKNDKLERPKHTTKCICGHTIIKNCYITDGKNILVVGSGCIKNFNNGKKRV